MDNERRYCPDSCWRCWRGHFCSRSPTSCSPRSRPRPDDFEPAVDLGREEELPPGSNERGAADVRAGTRSGAWTGWSWGVRRLRAIRNCPRCSTSCHGEIGPGELMGRPVNTLLDEVLAPSTRGIHASGRVLRRPERTTKTTGESPLGRLK